VPEPVVGGPYSDRLSVLILGRPVEMSAGMAFQVCVARALAPSIHWRASSTVFGVGMLCWYQAR
jgi:hypothetical protein